MLHAALVADLWKLGHHNPDQVMSAYCYPEALRSHCNRFLQFSWHPGNFLSSLLCFFFTPVTLAQCGEDGSFQLGFHTLYIGISLAFLKTEAELKEDVGGNISDEGGEIWPQQTPTL